MTVTKLFCLGIDSSLPAPDTRRRIHESVITSKVGGSVTGVVEEDVDEIAKLTVDLVVAGSPSRRPGTEVPKRGTDPSWGRPKSAGKDPCGDSGTRASATG